MKYYSFPSRTSPTNKITSQLTRTRALLILTLLAALASLPFYVLAQTDTAPAKARRSAGYREYGNGAFVITQGGDGKTVCRAATADEVRILNSAPANPALHQINHLQTDSVASNQIESATGLTIVLRATSQLEANTVAKNAFIAAAAKWESLIKDPITINLDVDFGTTFFGTPFSGATVLGETQSQLLYSPGNYTDIRQRLNNHATGTESSLYNVLPATSVPTDIGSVDTVLLSSPLLRTLGILPAVADDSEEGDIGPAPRIGFNSGFGFDFDPNNGISSNLTDFDAVAVHEMGHVLGFNSLVGDREQVPDDPLAVSVWDIFRFRPGTASLNTFSTAQRILSSGGMQVHFSGGPEFGLSTGRPDGTGGDGNQGSHWQDDQDTSHYLGIMDPTIARGQRETMTTNDEQAIDAFGFTVTPTTPPPNDAFANAQTIAGASGSVNGTNIGATKEAGEPSHEPLGNPGGRSVWYRWTAPSSGNTTFTTAGSTYDTLLAVYTGSNVSALTSIVKNDDVSPGITTSIVQFSAVGGTTYQIAVDGFDGDQGNITLNFHPTNTVQFTVNNNNATETPNATTKVDLTVTRTGITTSAATVNYATSDGTASDRSDYETALGTLTFAANETSKTITVFIVDDAYGEPAETFNVNLSSPKGCTLASPATVLINITSNEDLNGANPVKDASFNTDFFVRQHYVDFFNREPDAGGLAFWKNQIDECITQECREVRRINVSAAFFLSIEFQQTGYLVERLYKAAYGDAQSTSTLGGIPHTLLVPIVRLNEFLPDTQQIGRGVVIGQPGAEQVLELNKQTLIAEFVQRARFLTAFPLSLTPAQFVDKLNTNAGGVLSQSERDTLVNDLTAGTKTRAQVLRAVAEDPDLFDAETNRAFVLAQFFGYLRRNPNDAPEVGLDYTGYDFWLGKLNQFNGNFVNAEMVKAFIVSGEYQQRFGP
ncbi:MAG TPA: NF038122 family metalloprotease [Pyrinomonadaceae bacterium]|nr:NF038122 family metalloprotease [Pyrinomonadaceae bacterium]